MGTAVATHAISEVFDSIQGEGSLAGVPSTFVRTAHCNLSCSWCDAAYTWKGKVEYEVMSTADIVAKLNHHHVVLTGGEPTIAPDFADLVSDLATRNGVRHVTVETNGLTSPRIDRHRNVALWSVSPKIGSSGQQGQINLQSLQDFASLADRDSVEVQWKFVIDTEADFYAAIDLLNLLNGSSVWPVYFQPNGLCHNVAIRECWDEESHVVVTDQSEERRFEATPGTYNLLTTPYADRFRWLIELVMRSSHSLPYDVRVLPQTHKLAYGNKRGH